MHGFYIEVTHANTDRVPADYRRRQTLKNAERYLTPELKAFEDKALSAQERALAREKRLFEQLLADLAPAIEPFQQAADALAALDVLATLAERADTALSRPRSAASAESRSAAAATRSSSGRSRTSSPTISCSDPIARLLVVTGPNMGGKSTYMRQAAVIALLAHCGSFVPAAAAEIGPLDAIFTRIGAADDLAGGRSTFMVEMTEAASILHRATPQSLVLIDEIGRGTSTFDGLALAWAIAHHLAEKNRSLALFATHYFELTALAAEIEGCANVHFDAVEHGDGIVFLHAVEEGPANRSYGLQVAKLAGVPATRSARRARISRASTSSTRGLHGSTTCSPRARRDDGRDPGRLPATRRRALRAAARRARPRCAVAARRARGAVRTQAAGCARVDATWPRAGASRRAGSAGREEVERTATFRAGAPRQWWCPCGPCTWPCSIFLRGGADLDDPAVEAQPLAGERMVAVEHGLAVRDAGDAEHAALAVLLGAEWASNCSRPRPRRGSGRPPRCGPARRRSRRTRRRARG